MGRWRKQWGAVVFEEGKQKVTWFHRIVRTAILYSISRVDVEVWATVVLRLCMMRMPKQNITDNLSLAFVLDGV